MKSVPAIFKFVFAIMVGLIVSYSTIMLIEYINSFICKPPFQPQSPKDLHKLISLMPSYVCVALLIAYG